ncbi:DUF2268 domain-containing putative Zn-dependent protease [Vibrio caribbeanicus]|uniref:DUF2268 domain-containing putative Zn-dependent protease n=1 Tax=Vibrio caribbeanicus TaxID=701175 RepID=UPI003BB6BF35
MEPNLESTSFPFEQMFLSTKPDEYPHYAGYWVGYNLVVQYLHDQNSSISDIVTLDSFSFIYINNDIRNPNFFREKIFYLDHKKPIWNKRDLDNLE